MYCGYWFVCVFLYIPMLTPPSSLLVNGVSRKGRCPSSSSSMVNWIVGCRLLRWSRNVCVSSITQKVSSTYLFQILSTGVILSASSSNISRRCWQLQETLGNPWQLHPSASNTDDGCSIAAKTSASFFNKVYIHHWFFKNTTTMNYDR